ncbi:jg11722 [Pararge aegeria aegeria]|uniref:Phospholipase A2 n=1 Tax=Pararge aegeria aegeria TaxID=348720 RepID=A0A8S4S3K5_9NEOP|nr:jg11722 [Pararge aegeria aegeria]
MRTSGGYGESYAWSIRTWSNQEQNNPELLTQFYKPRMKSDEEDTGRLLRQLSNINRPLGVSFSQMTRLMGQCQQVEGVEAGEDGRERGEAQARLRAGGAHAGLLGGSPLSLLQGIIPGTKWCGTGDIAADYHDLGADRPLDRCCRTHDLCPSKVRAFSKRYNLTNNSLYSKSHCTCDDMLFDCLKTTNTSAAHLMGHIYFNIVQVPCLEDYRSSLQLLVSETVEVSTSGSEEVRRLTARNHELEKQLAQLKQQQQYDSMMVPGAFVRSLARKLVPETEEQPPVKRNEENELTNSIIEPLEMEISALKNKLRQTDAQLQETLAKVTSAAASGASSGASSGSDVKPETEGRQPCDMCANYERQLVAEQARADSARDRAAQLEQALKLKRLQTEALETRQRVAVLQQELDNSEKVQQDFVRLSQSLQVQLQRIREADTAVRWQHDDDVCECNACRAPLPTNKKKVSTAAG